MFSTNEKKAIELGEAGEKAIREQNEYDALQYIDYLKELGDELLDMNQEKDLKRVAISLRNIGNKATQINYAKSAVATLKVLKYISEEAIKQKYSDALWSLARAVQEIGKSAAQYQLLEPTKDSIEILEMIGLKAIENKMEVVTLWTTMSLEEIAYISGEQKLKEMNPAAKASREKIITASEKAGFVPRIQIEIYPKLISESISKFSELQNLQPAGYEGKSNEEFTEDEFFEGEMPEEEIENIKENEGNEDTEKGSEEKSK